MHKSVSSRLSFIFLLLMLFSLFGTVAYARADETTVEVFRLNDTFILLKITFPYDISGSFAGTMAGKHFDCVTIPSNVLICVGRFRAGSDPSFLTIYDQDTEEIVLQRVIKSPPSNGDDGEGEEQTPPPAPPSGGDDQSGDDSSGGDDIFIE